MFKSFPNQSRRVLFLLALDLALPRRIGLELLLDSVVVALLHLVHILPREVLAHIGVIHTGCGHALSLASVVGLFIAEEVLSGDLAA